MPFWLIFVKLIRKNYLNTMGQLLFKEQLSINIFLGIRLLLDLECLPFFDWDGNMHTSLKLLLPKRIMNEKRKRWKGQRKVKRQRRRIIEALFVLSSPCCCCCPLFMSNSSSIYFWRQFTGLHHTQILHTWPEGILY